MNRLVNFSKRNFIEVLRDSIIYIFCIGFPIVMLVLFQVINKYTGGNAPMFEIKALVPGVIVFSFTFVMLVMALLVSKDKQTFFLKRLYSSPMKPCDFVLGYASVGVVVGLCQIVICLFSGWILAVISKTQYISFVGCLILAVSQIPMLLICVFFGILMGIAFNDRTAPGVASIFISLSGMLGGCWMPVESMGAFETICRVLPFYPSVYIGRWASGAVNAFGQTYSFDLIAKLGLIPICVFLVFGIVFSSFVFKKNMVSDK